ncbi:MAG: hypothetical protein GY863_07990 [bacterium]|nr:hypothetical protein [bacterium]
MRDRIMDKSRDYLFKPTFITSVISIGFLVYIMLAIPAFKEMIFVNREILSTGEGLIIVGFLSILIFNLMSLIWICLRSFQAKHFTSANIAALFLGVFCLIAFIGEKVMVDEISREYLLGWETTGEWVILYALLTIQFIYNTSILLMIFMIIRERTSGKNLLNLQNNIT